MARRAWTVGLPPEAVQRIRDILNTWDRGNSKSDKGYNEWSLKITPSTGKPKEIDLIHTLPTGKEIKWTIRPG